MLFRAGEFPMRDVVMFYVPFDRRGWQVDEGPLPKREGKRLDAVPIRVRANTDAVRRYGAVPWLTAQKTAKAGIAHTHSCVSTNFISKVSCELVSHILTLIWH